MQDWSDFKFPLQPNMLVPQGATRYSGVVLQLCKGLSGRGAEGRVRDFSSCRLRAVFSFAPSKACMLFFYTV
jgi:hypothetical protein